jgi:predicted amidohydrolase
MGGMMVKIGIIQMQSEPLKVDKNLALAERLIAEVSDAGAQIVVLPEMFNVGFYFGEDLMTVAETLDGKTLRWLKSISSSRKIYLTTSIYEIYQGHYYNTMIMVGNDGSVQHYRKRNPTWFETSVWRRSDKAGPGIFETPYGRVGGVICFDSFSRETFEGFKDSSVDLVIIVSCWGVSDGGKWRPDVMLARPALKEWSRLATETVPLNYATQLGVPTVLVNQGGMTNTPCQIPRLYPFPPLKSMRYEFSGNSSVRDASGKVLVQANGNESEFCAVETVDVQPTIPSPEHKRTDITNRYMASDYYFVKPPLIARVFQAYFHSRLQEVYEKRRTKYQHSGSQTAQSE